MQGFMILAIIGTVRGTLVFYLMQIVDGRTDRQTDGKLNSNKQVQCLG